MADYPILYTFRRCPYAMRARMALLNAEICYQIREVDLSNKPKAMLDVSPKGTVPVLLCGADEILEESLHIMNWSLARNDPAGWKKFSAQQLDAMADLIDENDHDFKPHLDHYKYSDRHPDGSKQQYRERGERFLQTLEARLLNSAFLFGEQVCYADIAVFPFIRQFANVDSEWFGSAPYPGVRRWLTHHLQGELFKSVMKKYPPWKIDEPAIWSTPGVHRV